MKIMSSDRAGELCAMCLSLAPKGGAVGKAS
jgi:hypothetical protein